MITVAVLCFFAFPSVELIEFLLKLKTTTILGCLRQTKGLSLMSFEWLLLLQLNQSQIASLLFNVDALIVG